MDDLLRGELLVMDSEDQRVREELARDGSLFDGYHPRMEEVHRRNGERLKQIIQEHGWPGQSLVGEDGAFAAWRLLQHCIGDPPFLRAMLPVLWDAGRRGDIPLWHAAYLEDRIRMYEGRPQLYGSQFWTDETGELQPYEIGLPEDLDRRRGEVGLEPFAERLATMRKVSADESKHAPKDYQEFMEKYEAWLKKTGWR
ncbi:MAG TPA: DUF6624 domain-containing protein [Pyrinomonadaceae bacterium]|nr:DUF6624 domain-containing protein [Pyrinomonadaceae bacterium]